MELSADARREISELGRRYGEPRVIDATIHDGFADPIRREDRFGEVLTLSSVAREVGHEHPPTPGECGCELDPVRRRASEAVHKHERLSVAGREVAHPCPLHLGALLLEPLELCESHSFDYAETVMSFPWPRTR